MTVNQRGEVCYTSFGELAKSMGIEKKVNPNKLRAQQENFQKHHKCRACGEPLTYMGGNYMYCTNEKCKGVKVIKKDAEGKEITTYEPSFDLLEDKYAGIASRLFA